jgi:REP element-mobilizing transposase RayT
MSGTRRSIRLKEYDYSTAGGYFITICTQNRRPVLRDPRLKGAVEDAWAWIERRFDNVELDEFVAMPDHVHFVVWLVESESCRGGHPAALDQRTPAASLGNVVGAFKTVAAKSINRLWDSVGEPVWQRNYFEHIIRDDQELERIRDYISSHPSEEQTHGVEEIAAVWRPPKGGQMPAPTEIGIPPPV